MKLNIPEYTLEVMRRYINHKLRPGNFMGSLLEGNTREALACADSTNTQYFNDIVVFVDMVKHIQPDKFDSYVVDNVNIIKEMGS